jgi:hypothetical protein
MRTRSTLSSILELIEEAAAAPQNAALPAIGTVQTSSDIEDCPDDRSLQHEPVLNDTSPQDVDPRNGCDSLPAPGSTSLGRGDFPDTQSVPPSEPTIEPQAPSVLGNISRFRLSQNFGATAPVRKLLTTVPIRKPHNQEFVRTSSDLIFDALTYAWKDDGKLFLVEPALIHLFPQGLRPTLLVGTMNRQGVFFLWPVYMKQGDEAWNDWHRSGYDAMVAGRKHWVRVESNRALGAYEISIAQVDGIPEPEWPGLTIEELLNVAFRDSVIDSADHIILKKLRGEE